MHVEGAVIVNDERVRDNCLTVYAMVKYIGVSHALHAEIERRGAGNTTLTHEERDAT